MIYIHIPFCLSKCPYCDFNSYAGAGALVPEYLRALEREMDGWLASRPPDGPVSSVYVGGGTPSVLGPAEIGGILEGVRARFGLQRGAEVTVEINPATWNGDAMREAVERGVTRLSLGIQSLDEEILRVLGRPHDVSSARRCLREALAAGADSVSADLIYGVPGQRLAGWKAGLREVLDLGVPHISAYALTVEEHTPLASSLARGELRLPEEEETVRMYRVACEMLEAGGYRHYEISNFALPGRTCRHNEGYWQRRPYLGLGAGAHSFAVGLRWWGPARPEDYIRNLCQGQARYGVEIVDDRSARREEIMLGLRTDRGIGGAGLGLSADTLEAWVRGGWLRITGDRLSLTDAGMLLSNELISTLMP